MRSGSDAGSSGHPARAASEETLGKMCEQVLEHMHEFISLGELVVAVCYGEPSLRKVSLAIDARNSLYSTNNLQQLLELSYEPPRPPSGGGVRPVGGSKIIRKFVFETAQKVFSAELADFSEDYELDNKQLANMDYISTIAATALHRKIELKCPELYATFEDEDEDAPITFGPKPPIEPHPHFDIVFQVTSMAYRLHPHRNVLQKVLTIYAHAKHTGKAVLDPLQQAGITMSYSWVRKQIGDLSNTIGKETIPAAHTKPIVLVHDNLKLKQAVVSQRGNNQTVSDNGTASTVLILPDNARVFEDPDNFVPLRRALKAKRIAGTAPELCY
ncbi:E3 ubiquitin-protein ligase listerin [Ceratobasidium sp. AG-Ba]|nr:E3 ubiquitin-protein ligase listerin [Ceratobasidium sp. AG-Ba]